MTQVYRERLPAFVDTAREVVLLHGWGSSSDVWRGIAPALRQHFNVTLVDLPYVSADRIVDDLLPLLPEHAVYVGWSLGGMVATRIAAAQPRRVLALITVASNLRFTASSQWPSAMPAETFEAFETLFARDPDRGLKRFHLLQCHGDAAGPVVSAGLDAQTVSVDSTALAAGLSLLRAWDHRSLLAQVDCPVLHIFGDHDALVPVAAADAIAAAHPQHSIVRMTGCGHVPFLSRPDDFILQCQHFLEAHDILGSDAATDMQQRRSSVSFKRDVARSFSRAAASYDSVAVLQRRVADRQLASLPAMQGKVVLDLGCGTGYGLAPLREQLGEGELIALDLAEGMLAYARQGSCCGEVDAWVCGDAEDLPLADHSIDIVFSSFSLQWCSNLTALYSELERVLRPGGRVYIATVGPESLHELRAAWQAVDGFVHVNRFAERAEIATAIQRSGLICTGWQEAFEQFHYSSLSELTRELKQLGAHNVNDGRPGGLTGRQRLRKLTDAYERFRDTSGRLPASWQVWYLQLEKLENAIV